MLAQHGIGDFKEPEPQSPGPYFHVWDWFLELHRRRGFDGAAGLSHAITWPAIDSWSRVTGTELAAHEIRLLTSLDDYFLTEERKARAKAEKEAQQRAKSKARR